MNESSTRIHAPLFFADDHRNIAVVESTTAAFKESKTPESQSGRSAYQPTTGRDPYGLQKTPAKDKRELIKAELAGCSTKPDPKLLDAFFPSPHEGQAILTALGDMYGAVDRRPAKRLNGQRPTTNLTRGWKNMPSPPAGKNKPGYKEDAITAVFVPILNTVIAKLKRGDCRVAVDRQSFPIPTRDGNTLKPDVFLWGKGSSAFPPVEDAPRRRSGQEGLAAAHQGPKVGEEGPPIEWPWCVIPIEVKTEKGRGGRGNDDTLFQLGTYVREVFTAQEHRRFVPSLILTECTVEFLLWDRIGVVVSERIDYHQNPVLFCNMLASVVTWDDRHLGFDTTVFHQHRDLQLRVKTKEPNEYVVEETFFRSYTLRGRGSTCWRVRKREDDGTRYVIVDSWVAGGIGREHAILREIEGMRAEHNIAGVGSINHVEDVEIPIPGTDASVPDTVKHNRRDGRFLGETDVVHTRTVVQCHMRECKPLENITSPKELVTALHDAITGLGAICVRKGIVHRDVVLWNILIQPTAPAGSRGILVDFSCAASTASGPVPARLESTPGSHVFMSCNSLEGRVTGHLDDLESFYWLLCFIVAGHTGPHLGTSRLSVKPPELEFWDAPRKVAAARHKAAHLENLNFTLPVQPQFGKAVERLTRKLHGFFHRRFWEAINHIDNDTPLPPADPREDYTEFLGYFAQAIKEIEAQEANIQCIPQKRKQEKQDEIFQVKKERRLKI